MHIRRLVKAGQTSHTVSLPKEWITKNNLKKGDTVYITNKTDQKLEISTEPSQKTIKKKEITINIDNKEIDTIQRNITSAYLNNNNTITLIGENITQQTKAIRKILHDFVALEISEQTSKRIIAKDLLNLQEISLDKTINRIDLIIRTMIDDTIKTFEGKKLQESIRFRDYDVNKLYFLGARLLKGALTDVNLAEQLKIEKNSILSQWDLLINLENLADYIKNISEISKTKKDKQLKTITEIIKQNYLDVMKANHNNNSELANSVIKRRKEINILCKKIDEETSSIIKAITTNINNIAKIIIDKE
ncbi:hypothetical protein KY314_01985 [Candidatus Woesearchaeota archaeon]|nr:hypothetical protein [Candidatus Woesearchaeota archaeon]